MTETTGHDEGGSSHHPSVRPILDIGAGDLELHALRDTSPASVREGVLWTFLSLRGPFPEDASLYWELPADAGRAKRVFDRLLAVPLEARTAFRRLILHVPSAVLPVLDDGRSEALRATGVRLGSEASDAGPMGADIARVLPDYVTVGPAFSQPQQPSTPSPLNETVRQAWALGAAVVATDVSSPDLLDALRLLGVRFAEGPLFGLPTRLRRPEDALSLARIASEEVTRASARARRGM